MDVKPQNGFKRIKFFYRRKARNFLAFFEEVALLVFKRKLAL
jgi:hypothetical protein